LGLPILHSDPPMYASHVAEAQAHATISDLLVEMSLTFCPGWT
jgi:hypothetical protein